MDKLTKNGNGGSLMDGANGITQESEWRNNGPRPTSSDVLGDIVEAQNQADHKCPKCGEWSFGFGSCSRCGATWEPPLIM